MRMSRAAAFRREGSTLLDEFAARSKRSPVLHDFLPVVEFLAPVTSMCRAVDSMASRILRRLAEVLARIFAGFRGQQERAPAPITGREETSETAVFIHVRCPQNHSSVAPRRNKKAATGSRLRLERFCFEDYYLVSSSGPPHRAGRLPAALEALSLRFARSARALPDRSDQFQHRQLRPSLCGCKARDTRVAASRCPKRAPSVSNSFFTDFGVVKKAAADAACAACRAWPA